MHLLHIVPSLEERHGGPSKSVRAIATALAGQGNEVDLLTTAPAGLAADRRETLNVETFRRDRPQKICPSRELRARLSTARADVVHHHALWLRTLHYAHGCATRLAVPLVVSPRGMMSDWAWHHHGLRKKIARRLIHPGALEAIAGWHATSAEEADEIKARGFPEPVCIAPNGVAAPERADLAVAEKFWRAACPLAPGQRVALFYSRFHEKKRVIELIDLWLERAPPDWVLLLVGMPETYTVEMLETYILRNSAGGRVRVFDGTGKPAPYAVASLFLLPSHSENFGQVIAEAMAGGLAALVTDTTPWRGLNATGGGRCVPWSEFGAALAALTAETPAAIRARGLLARAWALREFSWERSARALLDFYSALRPRGP